MRTSEQDNTQAFFFLPPPTPLFLRRTNKHSVQGINELEPYAQASNGTHDKQAELQKASHYPTVS